MNALRRIPMGPLAVIAGTISVIAWIVLDGTLPLIISILAGGTIALKATLGGDESESD